ncbi:13283_t:CDS:2 [Entrophospora sp. SA101]|nr:12795_t:CDS:2 [Entrophospora sp. SA101]CAJ0833930.1 13283_t:CDS:2 [Entrophospora sp. SA101]
MNLNNLLDEKLEPGFALKTGNIEKRKKYPPEDMLKELVETDELEAENNPSLQQVVENTSSN